MSGATLTVDFPSGRYWDTLIHLLKASMGLGILVMPNAFKNAGYLLGIVGTLFIGFLCTYTIHLLVAASYELSVRKKLPSLTYPNTVAAAFEVGPKFLQKYAWCAKFFTDIMLVVYQIGTSSVYLLFITSNIKSVVDTYYMDNTDFYMYMIISLVPILFISWIQNLKLLMPFSSIATLFTMISFGGIFYYIFREPLSFSHREAIGSSKTIPLFFGTVLFAMEAIGMVLPLENEMSRPKRFGNRFGVLNTTMVLITVLYIVFGLFGYMKYGDQLHGSITLNLPLNDTLANLIKMMLVASISICYVLSNYVAFDIVWKAIDLEKISYCRHITYEFGLRTTLLLATYTLAAAIPDLQTLISLVGTVCLSSVGIALPAVISHLTFAEERRADGRLPYFLFCLRNLLIITASVYAFVIGMTASFDSPQQCAA